VVLWFGPKEVIKILPDDGDNIFLKLAVEACTGYIVTGNAKDFLPGNSEK
jgi:hypothetical protein